MEVMRDRSREEGLEDCESENRNENPRNGEKGEFFEMKGAGLSERERERDIKVKKLPSQDINPHPTHTCTEPLPLPPCLKSLKNYLFIYCGNVLNTMFIYIFLWNMFIFIY